MTDEQNTEIQSATGPQGRLEVLVMRFEAMAKAREDQASKLRSSRNNQQFSAICGLESAAHAYRRCAEEARRVVNGEIPAEPGYRWD